jgi:dTMP kinase
MTKPTGKLIVIEGLEGAGKSTAVQTVVDMLHQYGIKTITTREPGGTEIGETLRSILKNPEYKDILDDKSELLLMYTARVQLLKEVIKPALKSAIWVIADRFELSTMAYQGGGRGLSQRMIQHLSDFCLDGFKPDLTLYLDLKPEQGIERAKLRGQFDRIEQQEIDFFHKVHQMYMNHVQGKPDIVMIDAALPLSQVQEQIKNAVHNYIE